MPKFLTRLAIIAIIIVSVAGCRNAVSEEALTITIAHMNDIAGRVDPAEGNRGGFPRISSKLAGLRRENPNLIFVVAGDLITGSPLSSLTHGEAIFRLANRFKMDAFVPGNHEFDYGLEQYSDFMKIADFPFVAANIHQDKVLLADAPCVIIDKGGVKIGVIGIANPATPFLTFPENTREVTFDQPDKFMAETIVKVKSAANIVVCLTHMGLDEDRKLASNYTGINLIIGGHSHDYLEHLERVKNTYIAQAGQNGRVMGLIRVKIDRKSSRVLSMSGRLIQLGPAVPEDPAMAEAVRDEEAKLPIKLETQIGRATTFMDRNRDIGPWMAGVISRSVNAEIGMVNVGGIRADFRPGPITYQEVFEVMPFDNMAVTAMIPGASLIQWLDGRQLILDRSIKINSSKLYKVGTSDFVASLYRIPPDRVVKTSTMVRDLMIEEIKVRGTIP